MRPREAHLPIREAFLPAIINLYRNEHTNTSQGPIGYIGPTGADRAKGFLTIKGDTTESVAFILDAIAYGINGINGHPVAETASFLKECTRLSIRAVVSEEMMDLLRSQAKTLNIDIEAVIPNGRNNIVSFGFNTPERRLTPEQKSDYADFLNRELPEKVNNSPDIASTLRVVRDDEYRIHTLTGRGKLGKINDLGMDIGSFAELLRVSFGYSQQAALNVLQSKDNIISLAVRNGKTAGLSVIEKIEINVGNEKFFIAEITDVVVAYPTNHGTQYENNLGKNLYLALTAHTLAKMCEFPDHVIFGEFTLTHKTSPTASAREGLQYAGTLPLNAIIDEQMVSFMVMYVPNYETLMALNRAVEWALR
jgi:hypothetical protein